MDLTQAAAIGFFGGLGSQVARLPMVGFEKAVIEPMARRAFRRGTARITPHLAELFNRLDPLMPTKIAALTPEQLENWVRENLERITGEAWPDPAELEPFWEAFDPRKCAKRSATIEGL